MAYSFAGAWYTDTPEAVSTLSARGFNVFYIPAGIPDAQLDATLAALVAGQYAVVDLSGFGAVQNWNWPGTRNAQSIVQRLIGRPHILGYLTFDECNNGSMPAETNVAVQRGWYNVIKAADPGRAVLVNYNVTGDGFPDDGAVVAQRGLAWDYACVDAYPVRYGQDDAYAADWLRRAAAAVRAKFAADTWILPFQQACGCSSEPPWSVPLGNYNWKALRRIDGLLYDQDAIWRASGCLDVSHYVGYYGAWGTVPDEDISCRWTPPMLDEATGVVMANASRWP